ncbi:hypothetical protein ABFS83_14G273900 [Erythranthe nasuta]
MIAAIVRQSGINLCLKNSSPLRKSDVVFSHLLLHFSTVTDPTVPEMLMRKHNFSPAAASQAAPVLARMRNPNKSESAITFLKENGFSKTQVDNIVKIWPQFLSANLEKTIKPKINIFQDSGFSANDAVAIISNDPRILRQSLKNRIIPCLSTLKGLLGSNFEVARLLKNCGWFLETNLDNNLIQNVEFLKNYGLPLEQITWSMHYFPMILLRKPETVRKFVYKAEKMGVRKSSRMFIHAVRLFSSMSEETLELKLRTFHALGFSEDDIAATFRSVPLVFGVSEKKIKEVKDVLFATGKYKMSCIVKNPVSFMYSVEKRYKPRFKVLEILESEGLIEKWPCLAVLCRMSGKKFYEKFVGPYLDRVGDVYVAKGVVIGNGEVERGFEC